MGRTATQIFPLTQPGNIIQDEDIYSSSPPPSLDSSLGRMNLLDSDITECETDNNYSDCDMPLTPVLNSVFPSANEIDYNAIPSISSVPLLSSPATPFCLQIMPTTSAAHVTSFDLQTTPITTERQKTRSANVMQQILDHV